MNGEAVINKHRLRGRYTVLALFFGLCFSVVIVRLFVLSVLCYDDYTEKMLDNIQSKTALRAERGVIYDKNMNALAVNVTSWRVYLSPIDIKDENEAEKIARGLSEILGVNYETVLKGAKNSATRDVTVKKKSSESEKDKVLAFVLENDLSHAVHTEAGTSRYYPYGSLAAHTLGFMGTDKGLTGIEAYYDGYLSGTDGYYVTSKNAAGETLPDSYDTYIEATDGCSVITTIDVTLQALLEAQLEATYIDSKCDDRVTGIVMDPETGAILAMATYPSFDLNFPYVLDSYSVNFLENSGLLEGSDDYKSAYNSALYGMWNNKAVTGLYEPGSTFKIITTSVALECGVSRVSECFHCSGALKVEGYGQAIRCHKRQGHGTLNFAEALQKSCNPTMMTLAARIGNKRFMEYFEAFGYTEKTGIDLPGESMGIFHDKEDFNTVELAVYSFGQTFKTTALQQLTAISAVANGGMSVTPHVVSEIRDADGNTVWSYSASNEKRIISENVCSTISDILEKGVSGDGGAKNAGVAGYKIAAKTGTSQKRDIRDENGNSYLYVGSCVAYAPSDDPDIAVIIAVDQPHSSIYYGSTVAAPYVSGFLSGALPYLGHEPSFSSEEDAKRNVTVGFYTDMSVKDAKSEIAKLGISVEVIGDGERVIAQVPFSGSVISRSGGRVILYTDGSESEEAEIPNVVGMTATDAIKKLIDLGFNVSIAGVSDYGRGVGAKVTAQSQVGVKIKKGGVITLTLRYLDGTE